MMDGVSFLVEVIKVSSYFVCCRNLEGVGVARGLKLAQPKVFVSRDAVGIVLLFLALSLPLSDYLSFLQQSLPLGEERPRSLSYGHRVNRAVELAVATALEALEKQHDLGYFEVVEILVQRGGALGSGLHVHLLVRACILVDVVDVTKQICLSCVFVGKADVEFRQGRVVARDTFHIRDVEHRQCPRCEVDTKRLKRAVIVCQR